MDYESQSPREQRATYLPLFLATLFGGGFLLFLIVITEGLLLGLVAVIGLTALTAVFHYYLWGRSMMARTTGEREEERMKMEQEKMDLD